MPLDFFLLNKIKMYYFLKVLFFILGMISFIHAVELTEKYPLYPYVLNEFDIEKEYIYDEDFNQFVLRNEKGLKKFYKQSLQRGKEILPTIQGLLMGEGISDLFIYLSMVESGFSMHAVSPKKAVGLWQFMPKTAQKYNLTVCSAYDERYDTARATIAAIQYLNKLYNQFGKWYLAAMAYNCGEGRMERAISKAGTEELSILLDPKEKYLPSETRKYIKKILLVAMIGENKTLELHTSKKNMMDDGLIDVEISSKTRLKEIAQLIKIDFNLLQKLNAHIRQDIKLKKNIKYKITIPIEKIFAFYLRYELDNDFRRVKPHLISHYVKLGETLDSIAQRYQTQSEEIKSENHLKNENLTLDKLLLIPVTKKVFENILENRYF